MRKTISAVIMKNLVSAFTVGQHCKRLSTCGMADARFSILQQSLDWDYVLRLAVQAGNANSLKLNLKF